MKLLDVSKCHEDSPEFRSSLEKMEEGMLQLERQMKKISSLCEEREALAQKDRQLYNELISEFDFFLKHEVDTEEPSIANLTEVMTTGLRQLIDNRERMFEQIKLGMLQPLHHFLDHELEQVKASQKTYHRAKAEAQHVVEKLSQCKRHEITGMSELSLQLFDSRYSLHKGACAYAMDLNHLHSKKTPNFLQKLVDFMTSQFSYFHLGQVTVDDIRPYMENTYTIMEKLRSQANRQDTQQRTQTTSRLGEVFMSRAKELALFHTHDLHFNQDTAKSTVMRHLKEHHSAVSVEDKELENFEKTAKNSTGLTRSGYLWYAETKTFGTHWTRLYFCIKKGLLVSAESTVKVRVPISLNLNLCSVKPAQATDTERNFCFKVISPIRSLLLQAESSRDVQQWMEVLQNAISHALHSPTTPEKDNSTPGFPLPPSSSSTSSSSSNTSSTNSRSPSHDDAPIPPVRRKTKSKVNVTKELYAVEGNDICADCGNSKPKWASINLGVLVCIECSGVHRSLGVYVSQVRSLTLDTLKPEWLEKLKEYGNKNSNAVYEKYLPEDFDREVVKTEEGRQEFINEKYIELKYTGEEDRERIRQKRQEARAESVRRSSKQISSQPSIPSTEPQKSDAAITSPPSSLATTASGNPAGVTRSNSVGSTLLTALKSSTSSEGRKQTVKKESPLLSKKKGKEKKEKKEKNGGKKSRKENNVVEVMGNGEGASDGGEGGGGERTEEEVKEPPQKETEVTEVTSTGDTSASNM